MDKLNVKNANGDIQTLRGISALLVVLAHAFHRTGTINSLHAGLLDWGGDLGMLGVSVFFAISGYIMLSTSWSLFGHWTSVKLFLMARAKRIIPVYWVATIVGGIIFFVFEKKVFSFYSYILSFLFLPNIPSSPNGQNPVLGVGWTLNYEFLFYLIFALGLFFNRALGLVISFVLLILLIGAGFASSVMGPVKTSHFLYFYANNVMIMFAVGMGIALVEKAGFKLITHTRFNPLALIIIFVLLLFAFDVVFLGGNSALKTFITFICSGLIVFIAVSRGLNSNKRAIIDTIFEDIGDKSYSIYLFHPILMTVIIALSQHFFSNHVIFMVIYSAILSSLFAYACYFLFERPFRKLFNGGYVLRRKAGA